MTDVTERARGDNDLARKLVFHEWLVMHDEWKLRGYGESSPRKPGVEQYFVWVDRTSWGDVVQSDAPRTLAILGQERVVLWAHNDAP